VELVVLSFVSLFVQLCFEMILLVVMGLLI